MGFFCCLVFVFVFVFSGEFNGLHETAEHWGPGILGELEACFGLHKGHPRRRVLSHVHSHLGRKHWEVSESSLFAKLHYSKSLTYRLSTVGESLGFPDTVSIGPFSFQCLGESFEQLLDAPCLEALP